MKVLLFPFRLIWNLLTGILRLTGRLIATLLGIIIMIAGVLVSLTIVGAIIGIPLAIFGFTLMLRGLF